MDDTNTPDKVIDTHDTPTALATLKGRRVDISDTYVACHHCPNDTHHDYQCETIEDNDERGHYVLVPWLDLERYKAAVARLETELAFAEHLEKETSTLREVELMLKLEERKAKHIADLTKEYVAKEALTDEVRSLEMTLDGMREWINTMSASNHDLQTELARWEDLATEKLNLSEFFYLPVGKELMAKIVALRESGPVPVHHLTVANVPWEELEGLTEDEISVWGDHIL